MTVIDVHAHVVPFDVFSGLHRKFPGLAPEAVQDDDGVFLVYANGMKLGPLPDGMGDLDVRLAAMDRQGVDVQVLSLPPSFFGYRVAEEDAHTWAATLNDAVIAIAESAPERFQVLATLPMQNPAAAVREWQRVARSSVVRGVEIGTKICDVELDDGRFDAVWSVLEDADAGVMLHPDQMSSVAHERLANYYLTNLVGNPVDTTIAVAKLVFGGVLERHPRLKIGCVHAGGFVPYQIGRWDHGWRYRSESKQLLRHKPSDFLPQLYFDTITHDSTTLRFLGERVGWGQVMLGSDYPYDMGDETSAERVRDAVIDDDARRQVVTATAHRFLRAQ